MKNTFITKQTEDFKTYNLTICIIKPSNNFWSTTFGTTPMQDLKIMTKRP